MTPDAPMITVVIPSFNRGLKALPTVDAVRAQTFRQFEVIIVDDGSIEPYAQELTEVAGNDVRIVRRENGGISAARNTGASASRGRFIAPLDDDDIPDPDWLDQLTKSLRTPSDHVATCGYRVNDPDTGEGSGTVLPHPLGPAFSDYTGCFLAGTFIVSANAYHEIGGFDEGLASSHQTEFSIRLLSACRANSWGVHAVQQPLLTIFRRSQTRVERSPLKILRGTTRILELHSDKLRLDPNAMVNFHSIAGVAAVRLGQDRLARKHFFQAWREAPLRPKSAARAVASLLPPVSRAFWIRGDR